MNNPLMSMGRDLPDYSAIKAEHIAPAIETLLSRTQTALDKALDQSTPATWEDLITPLESATEELGRAWGVINHLNSVADNPEFRKAHASMLPKVTAFWSSFAQNLVLFNRYRELHTSINFGSLDRSQKRVIENSLRSRTS